MSDNSEIVNENALQRLGRLQTRPNLSKLEPNLFSLGPLPGEVIEIVGESSVGKTFLLTEFVKKCVLPKSYQSLIIGGLDAEVIFINADHHFSVMTLVKLMKMYLHSCFPKKCRNRENIIEDIIQNSLKKCVILNVFDSETLHTTFYLIQRLLSVNQQVSLLIIDSISAFYWLDRMSDGARKMDSYVNNILKSLHHCINPFKITVIFSRPAYFQTKTNMASDCSAVYDLRHVNTSICLKPFNRESGSSHVAEVRTPTAFFVKFYTISDGGISWSL